MAKKVLFVTHCNGNSGCSDCDFQLTADQTIDLQRISGADGEVQMKTVSCDEIPCWYELIYAGDDCNILAVCPYMVSDLLDADVIPKISKPVIALVGDTWYEISLKKL